MGRFLLKTKRSRGLIGTGGAFIKSMKEKHNVDYKFPDSLTDHRVLTLAGTRDCIFACLKECLQHMKDPPYYQLQNGKNLAYEVNFLVQNGLGGGILGSGGARINDLRKTTDTLLKMYPETLPLSSERVFGVAAHTEDSLITVLDKSLDLMDAVTN